MEAKGKGTRRKTTGQRSQKEAPVGSSGIRVSLSRPLSSLDIFECCIKRAQNLIRLHTAAHGRAAKPEKWMADAHRAAIVLAISALDAFVRAFVLSRVRDLLANKTRALPESLSTSIRRVLKEEALLEAARQDDLLERVERAFAASFERRSFQGTRNIEESLKLVGFDNVFHAVAVRAKMNEDTLRADLDGFTQRRHAIAHRADYDLSQNPATELAVTKKDAEECIRLVSKIAKCVHQLGAKS